MEVAVAALSIGEVTNEYNSYLFKEKTFDGYSVRYIHFISIRWFTIYKITRIQQQKKVGGLNAHVFDAPTCHMI